MKFSKFHLMILALLLVGIALVGCVQVAAPPASVEETAGGEEGEAAAVEEAEAEPEEAVQDLYFVYVPKVVHPWYDDVKNGMEQAIAELAEQGINVKYEWDAPPQADVVLWTERLESAIAKEPDVLAVSCLDAEAGQPLIEEAVARGIPVVGFDTPCPGSPLTTFVGHENYVPDGAEMAEVLAEALGGEGKIALLMGSPGAANHKQRIEGFKEKIAEYPGIEIVAEEYDNDDLERAVNLTASILQAHPDLDGIYGANATAPIGAGNAIVEAGKKGEIVLVGHDDLPEMVSFVKDETALAMSLQRVPEIGYWSINHMAALGQGHTAPEVHDTGSFVVDKSTVDTYKSATVEPKSDLYFVYVPKVVHPWYDDVKNGMEQAIAELAEQGINVKYEWDAPPQADVVLWTERLESAIAKEPDVLAVSCLDAEAGQPLIEEAVARGIPVVGFDTPCPGSPLTTFVGHENYVPDGAEMAEVLAEALGGEGKIALLMGSPGAANHKQRIEGFKEKIAEYPGIEIVAEEYDNDDLERAVNLTASILQAHPDLDGIYGANATAPIGAGNAIVEAGKKGEIVLVGHDDLPEMVSFVKDETALAMSLQRVPEIGYWSINYMAALGQGRTAPTVHDTGSFVVDKSLVETYK